jgi:arylsulfatase A-like enzyme
MKPNVILIVCDTLRKNLLGARTPAIDSLSRDSMVYDNCIAPATWTFPSHASLFTGMYASEHGIHETKEVKLDELSDYNSKLDAERLAEYMQKKGYYTLGISNNFMCSRFTGFDYGFDYFFNIESSPWGRSKTATEARLLGANSLQVAGELIKRGRGNELLKFAREYLKVRSTNMIVDYPRNKGADLTNEIINNMALRDNFFLFINYWELHDPYRGQNATVMLEEFTGIRKISERMVRYLKQEYVRETEYLDKRIGDFLSMLKRRGLYDNSMIILMSDHGQAFNEHGFVYHGIQLYDEIVRVPLVIKYPGGKKFRKRNGYQSLVTIPALIKDIVNGKDDRRLTVDKVFTEAYGNIDRLPKSYDFRMDYVNENYEKSRAAIYKDGYKLSVNGSDGIVEEFLKEDREVSVDKHRKAFTMLADELRDFKRKETFIVPDA